jgi:hypothetical protein
VLSDWGEFCTEFDIQSQLVILQLRWLEQPANFGPSFNVGRPCIALLLLFLYQIELCVVTRKFSQRDEEVPEGQPELIILGIEGEKPLNKYLDLLPV